MYRQEVRAVPCTYERFLLFNVREAVPCTYERLLLFNVLVVVVEAPVDLVVLLPLRHVLYLLGPVVDSPENSDSFVNIRLCLYQDSLNPDLDPSFLLNPDPGLKFWRPNIVFKNIKIILYFSFRPAWKLQPYREIIQLSQVWFFFPFFFLLAFGAILALLGHISTFCVRYFKCICATKGIISHFCFKWKLLCRYLSKFVLILIIIKL